MSSSENWVAWRLQNGSFARHISLAITCVGRCHDGFDEVVKGAGVGAGDEALDGFGGPLGADIRPFGGGGEDLGQFGQGDISEEVVLGADDHGQGVVPTWNSTGVRPMAAQDSTSLSLMSRVALAMSVSPV